MKQDSPTKSKNEPELDLDYFFNLAKQQMQDAVPDSIKKSLATQLKRQKEATDRINEEGIVVRDLKGSVIAHPAIKIEQETVKVISEIFKKFGFRR